MGWFGQNNASTNMSQFHAHAFAIKQAINMMSTSTLVKVHKYKKSDSSKEDTSGSVNPIGRVDVQPLVNLMDGRGNGFKHVKAYNLPHFRLHSGDQAIIMDPQKDDVGLAIFADHDVSQVKRTLDISNPGSRRRFDMSDGIFFGVVLSKKAPKSYLQWDNKGTINKTPDDGDTMTSIKKGQITRKVKSGKISDNASDLLERTITGSGHIQDTATTIKHNGNTDVSGTLGVSQITTALGFNALSDRRSKSGLKKLDDIFQRAMQIRLFEYQLRESIIQDGKVTRKRKNSIHTFGIIAQDLRELFPEIVFGKEDEELLSIAESKVGVIALGALQEYVRTQNAHVSRLEQRIAALERRR